MTGSRDFRKIIRQMPKVELHLHLEGAFPLEFLLELINKYGGDPSIPSIEDLQARFVFRDFPHFMETWFWKNQFFRSGEDFEESTYRTLAGLHQQNVIYAEVFFSPHDFASDKLSIEEITEATLAGVRRAETDFGIKCGLIADLVRNYGAESASHRLNCITPYHDRGVIGIGLGGSEQEYPAQLYTEVYREARAQGFHLTAHAGEVSGPESIRAAVQQLGAERIGHGVRILEDPDLVRHLVQNNIPLEVCVTSNVKTGIFPSVTDHPVKNLIDQGLIVTINSDDPTMFGTTLTDEFHLLYEQLDFTIPMIRQLTYNAIDSTFLPEPEKRRLRQLADEYWSGLESEA